MVELVLPFSRENNADTHEGSSPRCELYEMLPEKLRAVCDEHKHLLEYLHMVPISQFGVPRYYRKLSRKLEDVKEPNLIYPVGEGIFVHILVDFQESRHHYILVEPTLTQDLDKLAEAIEDRCIEFGDRLPAFDIDGDQQDQLMGYVDEMTTIGESVEPDSPRRRIPWIGRAKRGFKRVGLSERELAGIKYLFIRDKIGLGPLQPLLLDSYIEDISCSGLGQLFIEHKIFKGLKSTITFNTLDELDSFVLRLAEQIKKPVTYKAPIADATLPGGARINIVYGRDVSKRGSNFSIRKFSEVPASIFDLVTFGTVDYLMLAYFSLVVGAGMNIFIAGESACGKTTMLNALTVFFGPTSKVITIEDTPELQVPHDNWIREVTQNNTAQGTGAKVDTFDLLKAALRQRPDQILVGEIRGAEGSVAFQAMQTGHTVMATFHAASVEKLIQRLTAAPILVPRTYIDNLNLAIMMSAVKLPNGKTGRRVTSVDEIIGYDSATESFNIMQAFRWDPETDKIDFTGRMSSYLLEHKIATRIGIPSTKLTKIYAEIDRRANIFGKLHQEKKVTNFYEVLEVLAAAQREGLL